MSERREPSGRFAGCDKRGGREYRAVRPNVSWISPHVRALLAACVVVMICASPGRAGGHNVASSFRVRTVSGESLDLDALRAKGPVVLDFWATWCKPCLAAIPEIEAMWQRHRAGGLTVIGISADGPRNQSKVRPFATRLGITYPIVLDSDEALQQRFQVRALPTTVLIGRDGRVIRFSQGYRPGETAALEAAVELLLGDAPAPGAESTTPDTSGTRP